jgi:hypothetical protein
LCLRCTGPSSMVQMAAQARSSQICVRAYFIHLHSCQAPCHLFRDSRVLCVEKVPYPRPSMKLLAAESRYPEPFWAQYLRGEPETEAIPENANFFWGVRLSSCWLYKQVSAKCQEQFCFTTMESAGTTKPGNMDATLCKYTSAGADSTCRTDMSWIASSVGIDSGVLDDPVCIPYNMRMVGV